MGDAQGNDNQWVWCRDKINLGGRSTADSLIKHAYQSYIHRWQSLATFGGPCSLQLGTESSGTTPNITFAMPMYAFNLSTLGMSKFTTVTGTTGGAGIDIATLPMYRLYSRKFVNANGTSGPQWSWFSTTGKKNSADGVTDGAVWQMEQLVNAKSVFPNVQKYLHKWSDVKLVLSGATTRPVKIHVKVVRFKDGNFAPDRTYSNFSSVLSYDGDGEVDPENARKTNLYWDQFFAKRMHPIGYVTNENETPLYTVKYHKTFDFTASNTTDIDTNADLKVVKMFMEANTLFNSDTGYSDLADPNDEKVYGSLSSFNPYGYKVTNFYTGAGNSGTRTATSPFQEASQCNWLLIYADNYTFQAQTSAPTVFPSFDIVVRNKYVLPPQAS